MKKIRVNPRQSASISGFTLVEMTVVFTVIAVLSGVIILYGKENRSQFILFQEQYRIISVLNRAKFLALQSYEREVFSDCGYGVHFDLTGDIFIFKDKKNFSLGENCQDVLHSFKFDSSDEKLENTDYQIPSSIKLGESIFTDIVFTAPYGYAAIVKNGSVQNEGVLELISTSGNNSVKIKVNKYGQISTE